MGVLITGAGQIGSQIARQVAERGERAILYDAAPQLSAIADIVPLDRVAVVVGDVGDLPLLLRTIRRERVARIIHTAGLLVAGVARNPYAGVRVNILGTATVLEAARLEGLTRVVFASSGTIYTSAYPAFTGPMAEDFPLRVLAERPTTVYAATKVLGEWLGLSYQEDSQFDFAALRYDSVFGPWRGSLGGRFSNLMQRLLMGAVQGRPVRIESPLTWSGGDQFVYAKDAARAAVLAAFADAGRLRQRVYNVGMGRLYGFWEIVDLVRAHAPGLDVQVDAVVDTGLGGGPIRPTAYDLTAAQAELGFAPEFDMEAAIADYLAWLRASGGRG